MGRYSSLIIPYKLDTIVCRVVVMHNVAQKDRVVITESFSYILLFIENVNTLQEQLCCLRNIRPHRYRTAQSPAREERLDCYRNIVYPLKVERRCVRLRYMSLAGWLSRRDIQAPVFSKNTTVLIIPLRDLHPPCISVQSLSRHVQPVQNCTGLKLHFFTRIKQ